MTVDDLVQALVALVAQGHATLEVLAAHPGLVDEVPVTEVNVIQDSQSDAQWVILR